MKLFTRKYVIYGNHLKLLKQRYLLTATATDTTIGQALTH